MIRFIVATLLLTTNVFAGLPPTALKGQGGSNVTTFNYQVPMNQATQISGPTSLIETGNGNFLANPGFEGTTGWTASGGATTAINTTAVGTGVNGYNWDSNAANQTLTGTAITIPTGWRGQNGAVSCSFKVPSGTSTHTIGFWDGTTLLHSKTITSSATFLRSTDNFPFPSSGTITVRITAIASNEPEIYIDDCYVGLAENFNIGVISQYGPWTSYTPTFSNLGTVSAISVRYRTIPEGMEIEGTWTNGTVVASTASMTLPSGCTLASDYSSNLQNVGWMTRAGSNFAASDYVLAEANATSLYFGLQFASGSGLAKVNGDAYSTNSKLSMHAIVRCQGFSSNTVFAGQNGNYDWTAYTPTFTGFGTATSVSCYHSRDNGDVLIRCSFTAGTTTATEARISLPTGLTSSASIGTLELAQGFVVAARASTTYFNVVPLMEPSVTYITFGLQSSVVNPTSKANGDSAFNSSTAIKVFARVPISGWGTNSNAPVLVGSVTSNSTGTLRIEAATLAAPSAGACAVTEIGSSDWINGNATSSGTGLCAITFNSGIFTAAPSCICTVAGNTSRECQVSTQATTSGATFQVDAAGTPANQIINIMCMGQR